MSVPRITDYLSAEELAALPNLELRARRLVEGFLNGVHRSPFQGCNVEFKEHRKYAHGDEIRSIDWRAFARTDRLHVRLHEEDTNLNTSLLLDRSASMDYRSGKAVMNKYDFARAVAAALLLFLNRQRDAFSLGLAGRSVSGLEKPSSSERNFERLLSALSAPADSGDCRWEEVRNVLIRELRPRSIVVLISDFYTEVKDLIPLLELIRRKNGELLLFHVFDPAERDFFEEDAMLLQDPETGEKMPVTPELIRKEYRELFAGHLTELSNLAAAFGGEYLPLCTERSPLALFGAWLRARERRGWGRRRG